MLVDAEKLNAFCRRILIDTLIRIFYLPLVALMAFIFDALAQHIEMCNDNLLIVILLTCWMESARRI